MIGNIIGGNLANILLAVNFRADMPDFDPRDDHPSMIIATLLFFLRSRRRGDPSFRLFSLHVYSLPVPNGERFEGETTDRPAKPPKDRTPCGSLPDLAVGSHLFVEGRCRLGVSEAIIGLTVVAVGTWPEIVRRPSPHGSDNPRLQWAMCWSNIFNMLGIGGVISPVAVHPHFIDVDFTVLLIATAGIVLYGHLRPVLGRAIGIVLFAAYAGYVISLF